MAKAKPISERLASIKAQREKLALIERKLETKERTEQRKRDTRRKIVVGSAVLNALDKDPALARTVARLLAASVTRDHDKAVIADLLAHAPPAPANEAAPPPPVAAFAQASATASIPARPPLPPQPVFDAEKITAGLKAAVFETIKAGSKS